MVFSNKVEASFQMVREGERQSFQFLNKPNKIITILLMIKRKVKWHTKSDQVQEFKADFKLTLIKMI